MQIFLIIKDQLREYPDIDNPNINFPKNIEISTSEYIYIPDIKAILKRFD